MVSYGELDATVMLRQSSGWKTGDQIERGGFRFLFLYTFLIRHDVLFGQFETNFLFLTR